MHIPQLEPIKITETSLSSGDSLTATFKNVLLHHASNFTANDIDFDVEHNRAMMRVYFPVVEFSSDYNVVGKVLVLQLNGSGKSYGNASRCSFKNFLDTLHFKFQLELKVQLLSLEVERLSKESNTFFSIKLK